MPSINRENKMTKNILVISASYRKGGNSDTLCDEFIKGANHVDLYDNMEKIPFDKIESFFKQNLQ